MNVFVFTKDIEKEMKISQNKLKTKNIRKHSKNRFELRMEKGGHKISKSFKTIGEAKKFRDEIISKD